MDDLTAKCRLYALDPKAHAEAQTGMEISLGESITRDAVELLTANPATA